VAAPFLVVAARSAFAAADPVFEDVAATLGHHAGSRFFRVALPGAWPTIRAGLVLAWLRAFGEFGATVMVAYHPYSLPVYTYVVFGGQGLPAMMPLLLPTLGAFSLDIAWAPVTRRLAIIGPSGSGKSLALRLIAGLETNEAGCVTLGATDLGALPPEARQIGYMPQDYGLFPHMTVAQQLAFPVHADAAAARYWVGHLGLGALENHLPKQLSFGQRQRVALARALTRHSQLLLFDEPFSALDTPRRRRLQQSLRELQREIEAVTIIVTHDPDEAALLADEILVVDQGRVLQAGGIAEVFARPATMRAAELLGLSNVGRGVVRGARRIELAPGWVVEADCADWPMGAQVMWRLASHAIVLAPDGPHTASVAAIELRRGERFARLDVCGATVDVALNGTRLDEGEQCRFFVDAAGVSVWPGG